MPEGNYSEKQWLNTVRNAFVNGAAGLMEVQDQAGNPVSVLCIQAEVEGGELFIPMARVLTLEEARTLKPPAAVVVEDNVNRVLHSDPFGKMEVEDL